ncbi:hypothetical protein [Motiliproteus sediminis]|uniref:hypothetical protein n=1 Tax=Motiliproteus sediminis TaxID=1468178 RepID=UPI001AEF384C|nr:hypothetical protein [Motiliproteus sediminis]
MLSRPIYESLPYAYIIAGCAVIVLLESKLAWIPGILLFIAGAHVWILRAQYRARLQRRPKARRRLPRPLYEAAPFLYLFAGLACLMLYLRYDGEQALPLTLAAAIMFFGAGLGGWLMRGYYRHYHDQSR